MADALVLCYHAVSERWPAPLSVTPAALRAQLGLLARRGFRGITFTQAVTAPPPGRSVAVTFDDAFASVLSLAAPALREVGWPGTVFVPTSFADEPRPLTWDGVDQWAASEHADEMLPLTWDQLRGLRDEGWEVGSHTVTHPHLTRLGDEDLDRELRDARAACERAMGEPCRSIAYPYGDVDARVVAAARAAGYETAAALPARMHAAADPLEWPRVGVWHTDDLRRFRIKASPVVRRLRTLAGR